MNPHPYNYYLEGVQKAYLEMILLDGGEIIRSLDEGEGFVTGSLDRGEGFE